MNRFCLKISTLILFTALSLLIRTNVIAQDSSHLRISLLTCTPGEELYSTFGHSGIRIMDSSSVTDLVFNYGTFDFDDKDFYLKFVRGKLLYFVSIERFRDFLESYRMENRGITEQVLNLSPDEKISIQQALFNNAREENKFYKYDFFLDNCTTRLRDIIVKYMKNKPSFVSVMPVKTRYRQAIHEYLDSNRQYWSKLGIDILLGAPTDAVMTTEQQQFLPDNLMKAFDQAKASPQLVAATIPVFNPASAEKEQTLFTPLFVFSLLFLLITSLWLPGWKWSETALAITDRLVLFSTGALGILLLFMWTGTDHAMCRNNFNLLWALPSHFVLVFFYRSSKAWVKTYFKFCFMGMILLGLCWFLLPQQLNTALLPILLLIITTCYRGWKYKGSQKI